MDPSIIFLGFALLNIFLLVILFRIYQRSLEENLTLNLLQKLSDIIISSITEIEEVAQKVSDAIAFDLGFQVGVILVTDHEKRTLKRIAVSRTQRVASAVKRIGFEFKGLETPLNDLTMQNNITVKVAQDGQPRVTSSLYDILYPHADRMQADFIQRVGDLSYSYVYPIYARGRRIGVMIFSLSSKEKTLSPKRVKEIMRVLQEVGIALDNSTLYQSLQEKNVQLQKTNEEVFRLNEKLHELDKLKDDFVSVASHELRTPMTAIRSYAWMALNRADIPLSDKMKRYLDRIHISTERLINLVNDMLNISRIESGRVEILPRSFSLEALAEDVATEIAPKAAEKSLHIEIQKAQVPAVFADADKVHQVLLNLLGNSMKFTPENGTISVNFFSDGHMVEVAVRDSGVGITKEDLGRLFQKFGRLDNSYVAAATSGGTGLGLYICKNLIELMKGKIWASSEGLGKGTTFTFSLPVATQDIISHPGSYTNKVADGAKTLEPVAL